MVGSCSAVAGEEDDELSDEEVALDVGKDEGSVDLDDADASDLDIGLKLPDPSDTEDGASSDFAMDFSELFGRENDVSEAGDDQAGPQEFDTAIGIQELEAEDLSDDALGVEGTDLNLEDGQSSPTPQEGDEEGALETFDLFIADESECEPSQTPWHGSTMATGDFEVVSSLGQWTLAGGGDVWLATPDRHDQLEFSAVASVALLGAPERPWSLLATKLGDLFRIDLSEDREPRPLDWKAALTLNSRTPATLTLSRIGERAEGLALSSTGGLLQISPGAIRRIHVPARPVTLPSRSERALILAERDNQLCLLRAPSADGPWEVRELPESINRVFGGGQVALTAQGEVLALANRQEGTFVSCDDGRRFSPIPGTAASVALASGSYRGDVKVWAIVSHEVRGQSDLLMIDPKLKSAERLARFETRDAQDGVFAPVACLDYEPASESLYAVGAFGLLRFTPATE